MARATCVWVVVDTASHALVAAFTVKSELRFWLMTNARQRYLIHRIPDGLAGGMQHAYTSEQILEDA